MNIIPLFTEEQIQAAKSTDLLTYLQKYEPSSIRKSGANEYCLVEHGSFKISNGKWCWHSRGFGGYSAYSFLVKVRGMEFKEAIQTLLDGGFTFVTPVHENSCHKKLQSKKPLILPKPNKNNDAVYAYLQGRGIQIEVIKQCIENNTLYEAAKTHHCVFVGFDGEKPKYACMRGTTGDLKRDAKNSDKRFGFVLPSKNPNSRNLIVFESAADVLSHASIYAIGGCGYDGHRLSLGGVSSLALINFLERHMEIDSIYLSLDNDKTGKEAIDRIIKELLKDKRFSHIKMTVAPPPIGKDFSNTLQAIRKMNKEQQTIRSKEAEFLF